MYALTTHLSFSYFGWFASGACFYLFHKSKQYSWFFYGIVMALLSSIILYFDNYITLISALLISLLFACSFIFSKIQKVLEFRILTFVGFVSYPLYLLHENMMISIAVELPLTFTNMPLILAPIIGIMLIVVLSYIISKYAEVPVKNITLSIGNKLSTLLSSSAHK